MNIKFNQQTGADSEMNSLLEQEDVNPIFLPLNESEKEQNNVERVLVVDDNQIKLSSGYKLGTITIPVNNGFSLYYHAKRTNTVDEYIESIKTFLAAANIKLSGSDISKLKSEYGKFHR